MDSDMLTAELAETVAGGQAFGSLSALSMLTTAWPGIIQRHLRRQPETSSVAVS